MGFQTATREEWVTARKLLLEKEKEYTKAGDALAAERRQLPHVKVDKPYIFQGPNGSLTLADLFEGRKQLIIYHFMLGPDDTEGCIGCSFLADNIPVYLQHLHSRDTTFAMVSRAPLEQIEAFKKRMGWTMPWYSSAGSDFNYHFHATNDEGVVPVMSNWEDKKTLEEKGKLFFTRGEQSGLSAFVFGPQGDVYHTYSGYERGIDGLCVTNQLLDLTALGRQDMLPKGIKALGWLHHDRYNGE
ncbi:DUF899-domain-containing protein [Hyaloscypha variabilis F]|uniref:DUF899-domain-containing protein n=1 Tax=Hyaloscypha variabilis (strain UAMH 11265 / GT02V1 / F) TaxID=1149755 RepID=A0A2J6QU32_HYAVF|nr:DUF899-domain-containing protein [Hyaloscypha variabilis F]